MTPTQRNFAILIAIAVAGFLYQQQFAVTAGTAEAILGIVFLVLITIALWQLYKSRESTINRMPAQWRLLLQAGAVVGYLTLITGLGFPSWAGWGSTFAIAFFVLLFGSLGAVYYAWQQRNTW